MAFTLPSPTKTEQPPVAHAWPVWVVGGGVTLAAWVYLVVMVWGMENMHVSADWGLMPRMAGWGPMDLVLVFVMWSLMMAAMMLPSVLPMMSLLRRIDASNADAGGVGRAFGFTLGYLSVWTGFSLLATVAQWGLLEARLVSPMMESASVYLSGGLLVLAGIYQFSAFKQACLRQCRSPLSFLLTGKTGSGYRLGLRLGAYCAGCCALLMALLFVLGVMNLVWIIVLTVIVLLEKLLPRAQTFSRVTGVILIGWGVALLLPALMAG